MACELSSERTGARMRATREMLGLTQHDVADAVSVRILTVKRWERGDQEPPADVVAWLEDLSEMQRDTVEAAVSAAVASAPLHGSVQLTYYRTQAQFDELGGDDGPVGMANANARLIAARLDAMGYDVGWAYPDDPGNVYHG